MNVGIVTFHRVYNYGAKLQQVGLFRAVEKLGHNARVVDVFDEVSRSLYHPRMRDFLQFQAGPARYARTAARNLVELGLRPFCSDIFARFEESHLRLGAPPGHPDAPAYSKLICGSDQVWNPQVTNGDPRYFLEFDGAGPASRIAYAPSFGGREQVPDAFLPQLSALLRNIDVLSCREQEGCDLVQRLTSRPCPRLPDPVFLLSKAEWEELATPPKRKPPGKFVFCFDMQHSPLLRQTGEALSREMGAQAFTLEGHLGKKGWRSPIGPGEFLWLIRNAEAVVTNSFHGTAMSILFRKPLKVVYPIGRSARLKEILERFSLTSQLVESPEDMRKPAIWDPRITEERMREERSLGVTFLEQALG